MRIPHRLYTNMKFLTLLLCGGAIMGVSIPAVHAQEDILLPAADAPAPALTAEEAAPPNPGALVAPVEPADSAAAEDAMDDLLRKIDQGGEEVQQPPPSVPEVTPEQSDAAPPPADTLASPPSTSSDAAVDVPTIPALPADNTVNENLFYDADNLVPTGEMGTKGGPRKVDPALQPASKLIVVKKDYGAGSVQAQLVSAERAVALGRYDSALEMYNALYQKNSRDPNILLGRAIAFQHLGQDDEAVRAYEELLDLRPENVEAQVNMLGLMGRKYPAVALQRLGDLREKEPGNVAILGQLAVLQANMGQYEDAFKYLGMASSMQPHNANHLYNMAVIADRAGKKDEAVKFYEDALEVDAIYGGSRSIPRDAIFERLARLR